MAVPRKKVSRMKRGTRRSADALMAPTYVEDKDSGERRRPHHIDLKPASTVIAKSWRSRKRHESGPPCGSVAAGSRAILRVR